VGADAPRPPAFPAPPAELREHLAAIARCPVVEHCLDAEHPTHPCATIVLDQWRDISPQGRMTHWRALHELPEPWEGHIDRAPILFVSSNPSIGGSLSEPLTLPPEPDTRREWLGTTASKHPSVRRVGGPKWDWDDDELVDFHQASFDLYIADGTHFRKPDGSLSQRPVMFWSAVKRRAQELIPARPVRPGIDYALTEVVRCKSRGERGVADAVATCADRYLLPTLEASGAQVIVGLGRWARIKLTELLGVRGRPAVVGPVVLGDRRRWIVFLPHPNARSPRSFEAVCTSEELTVLQEWLAAVRA
jgi:hypothetical protein